MAKSGKEMAKLFEKNGFTKIKGQGKGTKTAIIPNHKEPRKGMEHALLKLLEGEK